MDSSPIADEAATNRFLADRPHPIHEESDVEQE
jgi:hypothetical protein